MILITADIHLNDLPRDQYRHDWMANILPALLKKHNAELLLILGDLTDEKDRLSSWLVNQIVDHLTAITQICPIVIQKGNHDYVVADNPFFEFLGQIPGITWISKPTGAAAINRAHWNILGDCLFLPHTYNCERDWADIDFNNYNCIFTHQTFAGAAVGPRKLEGIDPAIFPIDIPVISGDIHQPQSFAPITYVGAPFLEDFGDNFNPRVLLLDTDTYKFKSITSPGPQKRLIEIDSVAKLDKISHIHRGDILKVRVSLAASAHAQWPAIQAEVKAWGVDNRYVIYLVQPQVIKATGGKAKARKVDNRTDEELLGTYAKSRAVGEATLKTGRILMEKV